LCAFDRALVDANVVEEFQNAQRRKHVVGGLKLALIGDPPEVQLLRILPGICGHDRQGGVLYSDARGTTIGKLPFVIQENQHRPCDEHQDALVEGAGRTAQYRPPAIAAWRGVPGENARIAALAFPILRLRQR